MTFYTLKEAASMLKISYSTMFTLVTTGKIKAVKIGRQWRISSDVINAFRS